jgi:DNA-binding transcriptional LysR family regulator
MARELGLVYRADRTLPRAATAFIELIRQRAKANDEVKPATAKAEAR